MPKNNSSNQDYTNNTDGWDLTGGTTSRRKLTVSGGDINLSNSSGALSISGSGANTHTLQNVSGTLYETGGADIAIIDGGTGASTQQAAINALTGTQSSAKFLRSDGTNATLASIQATDVPTLNQSTTGSAATAAKLTSARTINGVAFDGTANITAPDNTKVPTTTTVNGYALSSNITITGNDVLPNQSGNSGKYLTTDGSTSSWGSVSGGSNTFNDNYTAQANLTGSGIPTITGVVDGSNTTFTVPQGIYNALTLQVYLNGVLQVLGDAVVATTPTSGILTFTTAPLTGDQVYVLYQKSSTNSDQVVMEGDVKGGANSLNDRLNTISNFASPNAGGTTTGQFYDNSFQGSASGALAGAANRIDLAPYYTSSTLAIDQLGVTVSTLIASAKGKVVVYGSGSNQWPDTLLYETGDLDFSSTGYKYESLTFTFQSGTQYWVGIHSSSTATLRTVAVASAANLGLTSSTASSYATVLRRTLTYATSAPSPWNFVTTDLVANVTPPSIRFRAA